MQGGQTTTYAYDQAGNLRKVNQGIQTREFEYSSAGLLTWTKTPERQEERHQYDPKGRLQSSTDANNTTVTTSYDALDRPISIGSGGSLIAYSYYGGTGCKQGELATVSYNRHFYNHDDYDCLGRVVQATQTTSGDAARIMRYTYLLNDGAATFQYPGGRLVTYTHDDAGRPTNLASAGVDYVTTSGLPTSDKAYTPHGALAKRKLGSGVWENLQFDGALRLKALDVGAVPGTRSIFGLDYTFEQNGNVKSQSIADFTPSVARMQIYGYDAANRLASMTEDGSAVGQNFNYDPYGNLAATGTGTTDMPATLSLYDPLTNRFTPGNYEHNADGSLKRNRSWGYEYDWAGQLTRVTQDMSPDAQMQQALWRESVTSMMARAGR